jgi:hypothetical protein
MTKREAKLLVYGEISEALDSGLMDSLEDDYRITTSADLKRVQAAANEIAREMERRALKQAGKRVEVKRG